MDVNPLFNTIEQIELHHDRGDLIDYTLNRDNALVKKTTIQKIGTIFSKNLERDYTLMRNTLKNQGIQLQNKEVEDLTHAPKEKFLLFSFYFPQVLQNYLEKYREETGVAFNATKLTPEEFSMLEDLRQELKRTLVMWEIIDKIVPQEGNVTLQKHKSGETSATQKITQHKNYVDLHSELLSKPFTELENLTQVVHSLNKQLRYSLGQMNQSETSTTAIARVDENIANATKRSNEKRDIEIKKQIEKLKKENPNNPIIKELLKSLNPSLLNLKDNIQIKNLAEDQKNINDYIATKDDFDLISDFIKKHMKPLFIQYTKDQTKSESGVIVEYKLNTSEEELQKVMKKVNELTYTESPANYKYKNYWVFDPNMSMKQVEEKQKEFVSDVFPEILDSKFPRQSIVETVQEFVVVGESLEADLQAADMGFAAEFIQPYNTQLLSWLSGSNAKAIEFDRHYYDMLGRITPPDENTLKIFNRYVADIEKTLEELFFAKNRCINRQFFSKKLNQEK